MAQVTLGIGGRPYAVACRDGEESHLIKLATMLDGKAEQAQRAVGGSNEVRLLLLAGLLLADELHGLKSEGGASRALAALEVVADRLERIATALEPATADA